MEVLYPKCCGLDVHKKTVTACMRSGRQSEVRTFRTVTRELLALSDWLAEAGCTHVAMESTGVYWKPVFNLLEGRFTVMLVNPKHIKQVPGRKTDVRDCEWIAQLLQHGLLSPSFVPGQDLRELRDLTRHRTKLTQQRAAVSNRIQKVLEDANIKLASVASDILGVSGRRMLGAMASGQTDAEALADLSVAGLRKKIPELQEALEGRVTGHHRFLLGELVAQLEHLDAAIERVSGRIEERMRPFSAELERLDTIPGIGLPLAQAILAEIGPDMAQFPSATHLTSWAAVCPGNNESAGKHKSGKTAKGNRWLKAALAEGAWAISHTHDSSLAALYHRIARRRGKKRAITAVSRAILQIAYHLLREQTVYRELGYNYLDRHTAEQTQRYLIRRLQALGLAVTVEPLPQAA
jgi:transposase